jgi:hypothetical protein
MNIIEFEFELPAVPGHRNLLSHLDKSIKEMCQGRKLPIRFSMIASSTETYWCELGLIEGFDAYQYPSTTPMFSFRQRQRENINAFNAVLLIPTGIGCSIGGHAGDANPVARLFASACDTLITHPNVVNASDINDQTENTLYIEGSVITRLLMGTVGLQRVRSNRVLAIVEHHQDPTFTDTAINSVSAARISYGLDCPMVITITPGIKLKSLYTHSGRAAGRIEQLESVLQVLNKYRGQYDAVALSSQILMPANYHVEYYEKKGQMVNPWGGVEAMLTHSLSMLHNIPTAHAPMLESEEIANLELGVVDPRMAAEVISSGFFLCVLKGLQHSPRIIELENNRPEADLLCVENVSCMILPDGCIGLPTLAALEQNIPVIAVRENTNLMRNDLQQLPWASGQLHIVENYFEAAGVMAALREGLDPNSLRRPYAFTVTETVV